MENSTSLEPNSSILIVDDEKNVLEAIGFALRKHTDYEIDFAENGKEALEKWKMENASNHGYDLVITDLRMPEMDGVTLIQEIRKTDSNIAIIVLTGHGSLEISSPLLKKHQISDFVNKPLKIFEDLLFSIENALEKQRLTQQLMQKNQELEQTSRELRRTQNRLAKVLDIVEEAIITVDTRKQINFLNQRAEQILGYKTEEILGQPLEILMPPDSLPDSWNGSAISGAEFMRSQKASVQIPVLVKDQKQRLMEASVFYLKQGEETVLALILHEHNPAPSESLSEKRTYPITSNAELMNELQQERQRIQVLGEAFEGTVKLLFQGGQALIQELRSMDQVLNEMSDFLDEEYQTEELHELLVQVMSLSLQYWETTTGKTKFELAESSNIWKVYLDKSTYRTKTLDRYLQIETLPQIPRWKDVLATAQYVLAHCPPTPPLQSELESLVLKLQNLLRTAHFKNEVSPVNPSKN